jgi:hypothetical protein
MRKGELDQPGDDDDDGKIKSKRTVTAMFVGVEGKKEWKRMRS